MFWCRFREDIHIDSSICVVIIEKNSFLLFERWCFTTLIYSKLFHVVMNLFSSLNCFKLVFWYATNSLKEFRILLYSIVKSMWNKLSITRRLMSLTCNWIFHIVDYRTHLRDLYVKQKIEMMIIHRFFMFRRSDLEFLASMIKRKKKQQTWSSIFYFCNYCDRVCFRRVNVIRVSILEILALEYKA